MGAVALACLALTLPARSQLPSLGDAGDLSVNAERKLGERVAREMYRDPDYLEDPVLDEYVLRIWNRLLAGARERGELTSELGERFAWQVLLGKDRAINAFAVPGGYLGLNLGLISATTTSDELAAVLAHELSHVTQRHISRMIEQQSRQTPLLIAAMILGAIAAGKNGEAGRAAIVGGQAVAAQTQINFSREMEREADRIGLGVMTQAGFDPQGFVTMFEKLQHASRLTDNGAFPYLRTHPLTTERIGEMQSRLQLAQRGPAPEPDMVHAMMSGRAKVMSNPGVDVLRSFLSAEALRPSGHRSRQAGAVYAAALASMKLRDFAGAARYARQLEELASGNAEATREAALLSAEIGMAAGDSTRALALASAPGERRPELLLSSQARIQAGRAAEADTRLQTWVVTHPNDAQAWFTLAQAYAAQGQTLRSIRAEAEAQMAHLDYQAAMDRFRAAQEFAHKAPPGARDDIEASIVDARARTVGSLLREQALER